MSRSSFARCLAQIVGVAAHEVPLPDDGADEAAAAVPWLGMRGLGLVPIDDPAAFAWPGPWIARLAGGRHVLRFGSPSGTIDDPAGGPDEPIVTGWVVAPHDVGRWTAPPAAEPGAGTVSAIYVAAAAEAPVAAVEAARAVPGRGLEGDRYFDGTGTFGSGRPGSDLTLIAADVAAAHDLRGGEHRRNVVVDGVDVNALVGRRFLLGEVECLGQRLCEPCAHLDRVLGRTVLRPLVHRGGLRADVVGAGVVRVGDVVRAL